MRLRSWSLPLAIGLLQALACQAQNAITVTYSERPPYLMPSDSGPPSGLTATPAVNAFKAAGIPAVFARLPTNRQLAMVKEDLGPNCAIGWFWLPERAVYAKYTKPIYRDKDWWVLANAAFAAHGYTTLEAMLSHKETRVLVKDHYSYGEPLDKALAKYQPTIATSTAATQKMVQSISTGLVDLMLVSEDEGMYIMAHSGDLARNLRLLHPKDMPPGPDRHIMCSRSVPDEVIAKLNKVITFK
jgi:polar amino acid transport system substrate-binding protein